MIKAITILLLFQCIGEFTSRLLALPLPGPLLGMIILCAVLHFNIFNITDLHDTSEKILKHLSLLFVPAGVGITLHISLLSEQWIRVLLVLFVSTVITMVMTALTMRFLIRLTCSESTDEY